MKTPLDYFKRTQRWQYIGAIALSLLLSVFWVAWLFYLFEAYRFRPSGDVIFLFAMFALGLLALTGSNICLYRAARAWKTYFKTEESLQITTALKWQRYFLVSINLIVVGLFFLMTFFMYNVSS